MTNEELVRRYYGGDERALEELYRRNLGLIRRIARETAREFNCLHMDRERPGELSGYTKTILEDLCGEGALEFLTRVQSREYDESRAVLATYLYPHLKGRMTRWLEQHIGNLSLSKHEMDAVRQAQSLYHSGQFSIEEIAEKMDVLLEQAVKHIRYNTHFVGVNDLIPGSYDGDPFERLMPGNLSVSAEQVVYRKVCIELLQELFDALPKKDRDILGKFYGVFGFEKTSLKEIGMYHMMKESAVEKAKERAVTKLKKAYPGSRLQIWRNVHRMIRRPILPAKDDRALRRSFTTSTLRNQESGRSQFRYSLVRILRRQETATVPFRTCLEKSRVILAFLYVPCYNAEKHERPATMATHILVVDDETAIADLVEVYLKNEGFTIHKFYNASDALACVRTTRLDLAVLDVMLPDMDGFTLCQRIREDHLFPIIMLTAKVEDMDKIMGLTLGADDYITKPFNPLELVARVKTQLRRYTRYNPREGTVQEVTEYDFRGLQISKATHKCVLFGEELALTPLEFSILWYLCEHQGNVVSSEELFEHVWGEAFMDSNNTVMSHIARLREKMHEPSRKPKFIKTVWGVGYTIE